MAFSPYISVSERSSTANSGLAGAELVSEHNARPGCLSKRGLVSELGTENINILCITRPAPTYPIRGGFFAIGIPCTSKVDMNNPRHARLIYPLVHLDAKR